MAKEPEPIHSAAEEAWALAICLLCLVLLVAVVSFLAGAAHG